MPRLPRGQQGGRPVDVGVAVDHAEPDELRLFETGNHAEDPLLLAPFELSLKPNQTEMVAGQSVLAQLHHRERPPPGPGVGEPHRLHGAEPQGILAAARHHLDRQASLEEASLVDRVQARDLGSAQGLVKVPVLGLRHRTVQIVALSVVAAAGRASGSCRGGRAPPAAASPAPSATP